jgi:hypothetical protein
VKAPFDWSKIITPEAIAYAKASRERENPPDLSDSVRIITDNGPVFLLGPKGQRVADELLRKALAGI